MLETTVATPLTREQLIEQLNALADPVAQKQFLACHISWLDDHTIHLLKEECTKTVRANAQQALQLAELVLYAADLTGLSTHRAQGYIAKGNVWYLGGSGQYAEAVALYEQAAQIYQQVGQPVDAARARIGEVMALAYVGRIKDAVAIGHAAAQVLEQASEWLLLARLTVNLGHIQLRLADDAKALHLFDKARELYAKAGDIDAWAGALARLEHNCSIALRNLGRFAESIAIGEAALVRLQQTHQDGEAARARQTLAVTYFVRGQYNEALDLLNQAHDFFASDGRLRDAIRAELYITDCLLQLRRFGDVLERCQRMRQRLDAFGVHLEIGLTILNEAIAFQGLRRYGAAQQSLAEARTIFLTEGASVWLAIGDLEQANVLQRQGQHIESLQRLPAIQKIFRDHELPLEEARAHLSAAHAHLALKEWAAARAAAVYALQIAQQQDVLNLEYQAKHLLGQVARQQGDAQQALADFDHALAAVERLRSRLMVEFRADFLEDKQVIYEDAVDLHIELGQPEQGLAYTERAKSRALLDLLAHQVDIGVRSRRLEDADLVDELQALRTERDRLYGRWESNKVLSTEEELIERGGAQTLQQAVVLVEQKITALWHKLLIRNADYARDAALWQVQNEPVQPYLPVDGVLLEYFVIHGQLVAFVATQNTTEAYRLPTSLIEIQQLAQRLQLNLQSVPRQRPSQIAALLVNANALLQRLYERLLVPVLGALADYHHVIIVPHGPLHYLPFAALYDGQHYLIEKFELTYLPGSSLLRFCQPKNRRVGRSLVLGYSGNGRLPYAVNEAQAVARLLQAEAIVDEQVTKQNLLTAAANSSIIHLATHGDFRADNPLFSGLALADGWLTTLDIFNLRLDASLVTLSACQTGRSLIGGGDELFGLMRAFLYAGASSLMLSLWPVEDRATAQLIEQFYQQLTQGYTKASALRSAQLNFIRQASEQPLGEFYRHPYFWSPFFLVGDKGKL